MPEKTAEEFTADGWFRTGDQGVMDAEGYVTLTGRLKEIINRGGEKISPREVDEILMDHPAVAQVVCFGMPHPKLGEEVAAVVVLREGQPATERELQTLIKIASGRRLADIAEELMLSPKTVSVYRSRVLEKLKLSNNSELTVYAIRNGLV